MRSFGRPPHWLLVVLASLCGIAACGGDASGPRGVPLSVVVVAGDVRDESGSVRAGATVDVRVVDESGQVAPFGDCGAGAGWTAAGSSDETGAFEIAVTLSRFDHAVCVALLVEWTDPAGPTLRDSVSGLRATVLSGMEPDTVVFHAVVTE